MMGAPIEPFGAVDKPDPSLAADESSLIKSGWKLEPKNLLCVPPKSLDIYWQIRSDGSTEKISVQPFDKTEKTTSEHIQKKKEDNFNIGKSDKLIDIISLHYPIFRKKITPNRYYVDGSYYWHNEYWMATDTDRECGGIGARYFLPNHEKSK